MVAITATNSTTLSLQASVTKSRLEQAKREAAQAEANAETLRAQAQEQDHVAEQAHQRERMLNSSSTSNSANGSSSASAPVAAPVSSAPKKAGQSGAGYVETLDTVLEGANSPAKAEYTFPVQKNLVISSLFQKANQVWQATPPDTRVAKLYAGQGSANAGQSAGSLLSTKA
jgi:hypothetical protein